ncbi:NAD(+) synthase [Rhizobium rhizogenes]|uniref:NAD(+) synthase n=1 Tax=Rhizobium rhizogenes TaxID=359 RepID=UPI0022BBC5A7|nr:NAD(+) synthase [Rhizobium rhizogenes]MCZ7484078.1 NAD(+) synthase [Rhizobium rhizogenes]
MQMKTMIRNKQVTSATFPSAYAQGFVRCAVASHLVTPASPLANAAATIPLLESADEQSVGLLVLPELGLTGYAIDDLLHQQTLLDEAESALELLRKRTETLMPVVLVGMPVRWQGHLLNCAVVLHRGRLLGIVPKTYLPNYREFYEARHFASGAIVEKGATIEVLGTEVPIGTDLLFTAHDIENFVLAIEICEDVWVPTPPSSMAALAGATVIANLSASNAIIGKSAERHALCRVQSARCNAAYLYSAAGFGESTTDLAWDGHAMVYEAGTLLAESERFSTSAGMIVTDVDLELLAAERLRNGSLVANRRDLAPKAYRHIGFHLQPPASDIGLHRKVARFPFVPDDKDQLDVLCEEAFQIQSQGLARRLKASNIERVVIGVSGGLDSSHALLVALHAMDLLKLPRSNVLAWTLPAFATSNTTKSNAWRLMRALGVTADEIDVGPASMQMLRDIGHPAAEGEKVYDITFENVQAGARTSLLFRLANRHNAIVLGTGDLSELALGWATYGVGDHMSHYNVNCSVPKTLIQHLIRWVAARGLYGEEASDVLRNILSTEISPELVPGDADAPSQRTEDFVGPYALQDFNLFYTVRYGMRPSKLAFLAWHAWRDVKTGSWPPDFADADRRDYDLETIRSWLRVFIRRFFQTSQFKRSAVPNGPKTSSGGSLSPRGDWRMPSDASADAWLRELDLALAPPPKS